MSKEEFDQQRDHLVHALFAAVILVADEVAVHAINERRRSEGFDTCDPSTVVEVLYGADEMLAKWKKHRGIE